MILYILYIYIYTNTHKNNSKNTKSSKAIITASRKKYNETDWLFNNNISTIYTLYIGADDEYLIIIPTVTQYGKKYNALLTEIMVGTTNTRSPIISLVYCKNLSGRDTIESQHIFEYKRSINNSLLCFIYILMISLVGYRFVKKYNYV